MIETVEITLEEYYTERIPNPDGQGTGMYEYEYETEDVYRDGRLFKIAAMYSINGSFLICINDCDNDIISKWFPWETPVEDVHSEMLERITA